MAAETKTRLFASNNVVFLDMEWTAWEDSITSGWSDEREQREIVQLGAVRVDVVNGMAETDSLDVLVRPRIYPILSEYFIRLTGITQQRLDAGGVDIVEALERLSAFVGIDNVYSNGRDGEILMENCALYGISCPFDRNRFFNLRPVFSNAMGLPLSEIVSGNLPKILGFGDNGAAHNALFDARAVAEAARILHADGRL